MIGIIPAAGKGTRLGELTKEKSKELLPVGGKPIIEHVLDQFKEAEITQIFVIIGPGKEDIIKYLGNGTRIGLQISYLYQENPEGLARAIYEANGFVNESFAVVLGDNLLLPTSLLKTVISEHTTCGADVTLVGHEVSDPERFGVIESVDGKVTGLEEKPETPKTNNAIVGMYVFNSDIFKTIEETEKGAKGEYQITDTIKKMLDSGKDIRVVNHVGDWLDIGTKESYTTANKLLEERNGSHKN
jgi:glucose-1-phosphate thymidylyltransferase